jgi:hypothetical protein
VDNDGATFWNYIDSPMNQNLINSAHYIMEDLWTVSDTDENDDELFRSSEDAYLYTFYLILLFQRRMSKSKLLMT